MPKLSGIFDIFKNLESISPESILLRLDTPQKSEIVENYLANRLLYSPSVPTKTLEMKIDISILTEAIRLNPIIFYNHSLNQVVIPTGFIERFKPIEALIQAFVDGLGLATMTKIQIRNLDGSNINTTLIIPEKITEAPTHTLTIRAQEWERHYTLKNPTLGIFDAPANRQLVILLDGVQITQLQSENFGIVIDTRQKPKE